MKVIQSYQQGARHFAKNQPCEDRTFHLCKNGVNTIALADGAGSQKYTHSAVGAQCVTETICNFFCNNFDKFYEKSDIAELKSIIMAICQKKLFEKAQELGLDSIMRFSSTLLAVAIKDDRVIVCHIGDGVIGKLTPQGTSVVSVPDNGEFASTTYFITNPKADEYINIIKEKIDDTLSYFLMSDGTSEYVYDENNQRFHDAARKMALMPLRNDGQSKIEKTIKEFMIDADSSSDDCSFICISNTEDVENKVNLNFDKDKITEKVTEHLQKTPTNCGDLDDYSKQGNIYERKDYESEVPNNREKINKKLLIISVLVIIIVIIVGYTISKYNDNNYTINENEISSCDEISTKNN